MYIIKRDTLLDQAAVDVGVGGPFNAPHIVLYTNDIFPSRGTPLADFDIADFGGLTNNRLVVLGAPYLNDFDQAEVDGGLVSWLTSATTLLPITAYGYLLLTTGGTDWLVGERFAEPITFSRAGQSESLIPRLIWN